MRRKEELAKENKHLNQRLADEQIVKTLLQQENDNLYNMKDDQNQKLSEMNQKFNQVKDKLDNIQEKQVTEVKKERVVQETHWP